MNALFVRAQKKKRLPANTGCHSMQLEGDWAHKFLSWQLECFQSRNKMDCFEY